MARNEAEGFRLTIEAAKADRNSEAAAALEALEPYPGDLTVERIGAQRTWSIHCGGLSAYRESASAWFRAMRLSADYDDSELSAYNAGSLSSITALKAELNAADFDAVTESLVPIFLAPRTARFDDPVLGQRSLARTAGSPGQGELLV